MPRETFAGVRGNEQGRGLFYHGFGLGVSRGFFGFETFIHRDDELREWLQPGEPGVAGEELEEMIWRPDGADGFLVGHAFRVDERLVQIEERMAKVLQSFANFVCHSLKTSPLLVLEST